MILPWQETTWVTFPLWLQSTMEMQSATFPVMVSGQSVNVFPFPRLQTTTITREARYDHA